MITLDAVLAAGVHHHCGTLDVGVQEDLRVLDGAVYVALCREVHHDVRVLLLKELVDGFAIADVDLAEAEVRVL